MSSKALEQTKKPTTKAKSVKAAPVKKASQKGTKTASKRAGGVATQPTPTRSASPPQTHTPAEVSHRIHVLLHTMHQVERYEEGLCSMQDAIRRTGKLSAPLLRDLRALVDDLPSTEYQHDLDALRDAIG